MSTLDQMQAFVTVVEEGSFTAAALKFDLSPTAMSKKVALLEKSLNTRLLIRTPRLLTMTDIGKKYYAQCKKVLHEYQLSRLLTQDKTSHLSGTLNIVCLREIAQNLVYPTMAMFLEQYPHIVTNVSIKKLLPNMAVQNYDIAMGYDHSEVFGQWCNRPINRYSVYHTVLKPKAHIIAAYIEYLLQALKE